MQRTITIAIMLAVAVLAASCSGTGMHDNPTQPTSVSTGPSASFSAASATVFAQAASPSAAECPTLPPFSVPIGLVVHANRDLSVLVTSVRMRFSDPFNIEMPQVTLTAPQLTRQFGTNLVQARSSRTFPLKLGFGCGTGRSGIVTIAIDTEDEQGRRESGQITVAVR
jgi:zona occludens toxin (predicted ATPase)